MQLKTRNYANLISELQKRLDFNQAEIAKRIGATCLSISRRKNGHHQPSPMAAVSIPKGIALLRQADIDLGD